LLLLLLLQLQLKLSMQPVLAIPMPLHLKLLLPFIVLRQLLLPILLVLLLLLQLLLPVLLLPFMKLGLLAQSKTLNSSMSMRLLHCIRCVGSGSGMEASREEISSRCLLLPSSTEVAVWMPAVQLDLL